MGNNEKEEERRPNLWFYENGSPMDTADVVAVLGLTRLFAVDSSGVVSSNSRRFDIEALGLTFGVSTADDLVSVAVKTGKRDLVLVPGACCLLGRPNSGKTLMLDTLHLRNPEQVTVLRFREPEVDAMMSERQLVGRLFMALQSQAPVIAIDSLRTTFYSSGDGATGKGGVNMGIFATMTALDVIARHCGKVLFLALNPMTTDEDAIEFYLDAAKGSVTHTMYATKPESFNLSSRGSIDRGDVSLGYKALSKSEDHSKKQLAQIDVRAVEDSILDIYTLSSR